MNNRIRANNRGTQMNRRKTANQFGMPADAYASAQDYYISLNDDGISFEQMVEYQLDSYARYLDGHAGYENYLDFEPEYTPFFDWLESVITKTSSKNNSRRRRYAKGNTMEIANLNEAYSGSYFTILGAGGPAEDWVNGVNEMLEDEGVGTPVTWLRTNGEAVNNFVGPDNRDPFPSDLTILMFPLDGLNVGKLSMLRLSMPDFKWFDDVVDNMRN